MKDKLFLIASILVIVAGVIMTVGGIFAASDSPMFVIMGLVLVFMGVLFLITGFITPSVAQSKEGVAIAYLMIAASILAIMGSFRIDVLWILSLIGGGLVILSFLLWPCFCCQGKTKNRDKIIGIANAHDSITVFDISKRTGLPVQVVRDTIYDALGKHDLIGKMEGDTFVRGKPTTTTFTGSSTITREREIVKVLVVCPYCGAKTEQGLAKCQNCKADL